MLNYTTAEKSAVEWNITPRHVQYLCRTGKIEGAVKHAGVWFIPKDALIPVKNTKSNAQGFKFAGTKNKIFNSAIKLFLSEGFDAISLSDIAKDVGIQQSTIYNHFKSKKEILDTIYDFYCHHFLVERPSMEYMESKLQNESLISIIEHLKYDFQEEHKQKMYDITRIIFQRIAIDSRAREISKSLVVDAGVKYVEDIFNKGVKIGRFAPFDTHAMALFINSTRIFVLYNWIVDPSLPHMTKLLEDEQKLYEYSIAFIKDLKSL